MSLNYNYSKVKNHRDFTEADYNKLDTLIWLTMVIGIGSITEDNHREVYARLEFIHRLHGTNEFTLEDIKKFIGLETNVSKKTWLKFSKEQVERFHKELTQ